MPGHIRIPLLEETGYAYSIRAHRPLRRRGTTWGGVWIAARAERAPTLVRRALAPGANVGRCRVIERRLATAGVADPP